MPFHIITLKKQKCQDVKMPRLQGLFFFQYTKGSWLMISSPFNFSSFSAIARYCIDFRKRSGERRFLQNVSVWNCVIAQGRGKDSEGTRIAASPFTVMDTYSALWLISSRGYRYLSHSSHHTQVPVPVTKIPQ